MPYLYFIGIDVSKDTFDISFHNPQNKQKSLSYPNTHQGFTDFLGSIPLPEKTFIVLEATGGYETELLLFLHKNNIKIHRISPLKSSYYLRSVKTYAKNDVLDSQALAQIAFERHKTLPIFTAGSEKQRALYYLFSRKQDFIEMRKAEKQRLNHPNYQGFKDNISETIVFFDKKIAELDAQMQKEVDDCTVLTNIQKLLLSQKGVGE
jgi:transposase